MSSSDPLPLPPYLAHPRRASCLATGRLPRLGPLMGLLVVAAVGCGGDDDTPPTPPAAPTPTTVAFVDQAAAPGGDGSFEHPVQTLRQALELERPIEVIAVAGGRYPAPATWTFEFDLSIMPYTDQVPTLEVEENASALGWRSAGATLVLRDVELGSPLVFSDGAIELYQVAIADVAAPAVHLSGADALVFGLDVRRVVATDEVGAAGDGIVVEGGTLRWSGGQVADVPDRALVLQGAVAELSFLTLASTSRAPLTVIEQADVTAADLTIEDVGIGVYVGEARLHLERSSVRGASTAGLLASAGSDTTVVDSTFADCPNGHLSVMGEGASLTAERNLLHGADFASCVFASSTDGAVIVRENTIDSCAGNGIALSWVTDAVVEGNEVSHILPDPIFPELADGVGVLDSSARVEGNRIFDTAGYGFVANRSVVELVSNDIGPTQSAGVAFVEAGSGPSNARDNDIADALGAGIIVLGVEVAVTSNRISGTRYQSGDGFGDGIAFGMGANVAVTDNTISGSERNGIVFLDGALGSISGNTASDNNYYGILEVCSGEPNLVTLGANTLDGNTLGDQSLCSP